MGAHVSSSPNHQTLRESSFVTRFNVAAFGSFGFELNIADLPKAELKKIAAAIALYKEWREVLQKGTFYRINSGNHHEWTCVSPDKKKAVGLFFHALVQPNRPFGQFRAAGLDPDALYHFYNVKFDHDIRTFGDLINTASPIHVKQDSMMHRIIARHITMPGETDDFTVPGSVLMSAGVKLSGATVHFVSEECDGGPIIAQKAVAVMENDTPETLQKRIMEEAEWKLLPHAVSLFCQGRLSVKGRTVIIKEEE